MGLGSEVAFIGDIVYTDDLTLARIVGVSTSVRCELADGRIVERPRAELNLAARADFRPVGVPVGVPVELAQLDDAQSKEHAETEDLCALRILNDAAVVACLRARYNAHAIYTWTGSDTHSRDTTNMTLTRCRAYACGSESVRIP